MAAVDLAALPPTVTIRGLAALVGLPDPQPEADSAEETWEGLCARISRGAPAPYRVHVTADGRVREVTA
jgi:hypothetical protein